MKTPALKSLSDKELLTQIRRLRRREHLSTIEILLHLNEVERRRLDLKLGYNSLYDYCVKHLYYSSSGAGRRVAVARCIRRHPEVLSLLRSQKLNVTGVALVASVLNEGNKSRILGSIQGKSQSEIDAIAARYRRPVALRDRVKPVRVVMPEPKIAAVHGGHGKAQQSAAGGACENNHDSHNGSGLTLTNVTATGNGGGCAAPVRTEQKLFIQFLANKTFMKKYEEVRALLSQRMSDTSFENVFEALIDEFLGRHCPVRRKARRDEKTNARRTASTAPPVTVKTTPARTGTRRDPERTTAARKEAPRDPGKTTPARKEAPRDPGKTTPARTKPRRANATQEANPKRLSRHIPAAVRDKVYAREKGGCTYVGRTGKRCGSTQALQIDHIKPCARGGSNSASNLRLLCAKHNRLAAQEVFGEDFMERFCPRE